jgi:diguanylate cyclase (GGDEF)-like protein
LSKIDWAESNPPARIKPVGVIRRPKNAAMLRIDPFAGYVICGAGSIIGGLMLALAQAPDVRIKSALSTCGAAFMVLGFGLLQYLFFDQIPHWSIMAGAFGTMVGTFLFGWGFARLRNMRPRRAWLYIGLPAAVLIVAASAITLSDAGLALAFEITCAIIAGVICWLNRYYLTRPRNTVELLLGLNLIGYFISWLPRVTATFTSPAISLHLIQLPEPYVSLYGVFYGVLPIIISALTLSLVNAELTAKLTIRALTDELTGLYTRRAMVEMVPSVKEAAERARRAVCALVIDIDHFKKVNDTHGHAVGDLAIRQVADVLKLLVRSDALAVRYGGEEFVVVLPVDGRDGGERVADRLRAQVAATIIQTDSQALRITISVGVGYWRREETLEELLKRADAALYVAKHNGRNRVESEAA